MQHEKQANALTNSSCYTSDDENSSQSIHYTDDDDEQFIDIEQWTIDWNFNWNALDLFSFSVLSDKLRILYVSTFKHASILNKTSILFIGVL